MKLKNLGPTPLTLVLALTMAAAPVLAQQPTRNRGAAVKPATPVTLNFVNAEIEAVTRAIGVMMNRQFIIDPRVKGQITLYSEQQLSVQQAYRNYLAALRTLGFTVVESAGLYKVLPESDAKLQSGSVLVGEGAGAPRGDTILTQIFKLNHESANNLVAVLRPLISPNNTINASPGSNSLVITDYAENLQRLSRVITALDTPGATDIEIVPLRHAVASDTAALVQRLADGSAATPGAPAAAAGTGSLTVLADPRGNALILRASNPIRLAHARAIAEKLDQPSSDATGGSNIRVVYLKNADATKLATVLRAAFASGAGGAGSSGGSGGLSGLGSMNTALPTGMNNNSATQTGASAASTTPVAQSASPSTGGFVQADPATNSLIITAAEPLYRQIRNVIDQLDGRRAQVYVESMIVKVDVSKAGQFGIQWQNLFGNQGDRTLTGVGTNFGTGSGNIVQGSVAVAKGLTTIGTAAATAPTGLNIGVIKKIGNFYTLGALANFLEGQTGANVLSTPNLVALDNEEAKIVIGANVPFVTGSFTNTGSSGSAANPFQTIERKDVGLTLRVKSQIGENGTIRMTVYQENSAVIAATAGSLNGPSTDKSAIETTVTVDDGSILVLGGLLKDEYNDIDDRVPGLASIPLIGNLFKSESRKRVKTNLMVFLRPVVMRNQASADQVTMDRYDAIRAVQQSTQPAPSMILPDTGAPVLPNQPQQQPAQKPLQ